MIYADVGQLVDATFRLWLEPPDFQPALAFLDVAIDTDDTALVLGTFALPEDEQLLRVGLVIEIGAELMRVVGYDPASGILTVHRGELGTASSAHAQLAPVKLSPPYPRVDVLNAVSHNIVTLSPQLFTVNVIPVSEAEPGVAVVDDPLAVLAISIERESRVLVPANGCRIVDHHPSTGTRSLIMPHGLGEVWLRYKRRMAPATSEASTLVSLGMEPMWAPAVIAGAAGDMIVGRDVGRAQTEWVSQILEAEGVRFGQRQQIGFGLLQYRQLKIDEYSREMTQEYPETVVEQLDPFFVDGLL